MYIIILLLINLLLMAFYTQGLYITACLYSSEDVVIALTYCRPTMYLEFRSPLTVCLRVNI